MAFTDRIKVDLYGQYNNNTEHAYSYPDKITNQYSFTEATQWAAAITDPRALFQSVCKTGPCYMIYRHKNGYYYSYVERNASDSRSGLEMITIFVPNGVRAFGYTVLEVLKDLRALLIGSRRYDDMLVKNCISRISESNSKELFPVKSQQNPTGQSIAAFRTYKDESELSELFTFLKQAEYTNIDKLLLVKNTDVKEGTSLQHISQPIKRIFTIVPSTNVRADKSEVAIGDSFHITYTKEDCDPMGLDVRLEPTSSKYFRIEGNEVILFGPDQLKITFNKRLLIDVESLDMQHRKMEKVEAVFDGRVCNKQENGRLFALVPEDSIYEGSSAVLQVSAYQHEPKQTSVNLSNVRNNSVVRVVLTPKCVTVPISLCFKDPDEERSEDAYLPPFDLPINETDPLLRKLEYDHRFYGYPAHHLGNGQYRVEIPRGKKSKHGHRSGGGFPTWLKIVLISLGSIILAAALFLGGYILRHYEIIELPGFPIKSQQRQEQVNNPTSSQPNSNAQVDTTLRIQAAADNTVE